MEEDKMKDEAKAFVKEEKKMKSRVKAFPKEGDKKKMRGQVKASAKEGDKKKMKDEVNLGGLLDRMITIKDQQRQQDGEGQEEQPYNIAPSQERIKEEEGRENKQEQEGAKDDRTARGVTVQQYHDILSEDVNLLNGLSKAIRNYCGRQSEAPFVNLLSDYRQIVDSPSSDFKGLGERLCKLQKDYKLTDPVGHRMKDKVNLGTVIPTQDEQLLVVMDKDKAKRDILEAMRLVWNKINSVQDSAQQQPMSIAPSEEECKEREEEEEQEEKNQMGDIQSEKKKLDSTKIANNDQEEKEVGDGFDDVEQLLPKWKEMVKCETKKQRKM